MTSAIINKTSTSVNAAPRQYILAYLAAAIWITVSEVVRYFGFVMPMTREAFPQIPNVAPMDLPVFAIWSVWMALLTLMVVYSYWLHARIFGHTQRALFAAATAGWIFFFALFWLGNYNMNLASTNALVIALPWAWAELFIACWIAQILLRRG